jgi:hypothetical protein
MRRVGLVLACALMLMACFEQRKLSLGKVPAAGSAAVSGSGGRSGSAGDANGEDEESDEEEADNPSDMRGSAGADVDTP